MSEYFNKNDVTYDFADTESALIQNFKIDHPDAVTVTTRDQILTLVNLSDDYRKWYLEWKELRNTFSERPSFIGDTPDDLRLWRELMEDRKQLKKANIGWTNQVNAKSRELRETIDRVERERKQYYESLNPVIVISLINVNNLPKDKLLSIALEGDLEKREELITKLVTEYQKEFFEKYKETGKVDFPWLKKE